MWLFVVVYYLSLVGPLLLLTFLWRKLLSRETSKYTLTIALSATISYLYLLAALTNKSTVLGPD